MKKLFLLMALISLKFAGYSQVSPTADTLPTYVRAGKIPDFTTYKAPDSTVFTQSAIQKNKPLLLMIFSPDCGHCQHVTTEITTNMAHFKKTQILMVTWLPYGEMATFYKTYKIADFNEIKMLWDPKYFFLPYYHVQSYPKLIVYDKKGHFVKEFTGNIQIEEVWKAMGKE